MSSKRRSDFEPACTPDREVSDGGLKSVHNALDLLDCFTDRQELRVSEVARQLGVAKSTAHRLLATLCAHNYVIKNPETGQYRLGLHLCELGYLAVSRTELQRKALPILEEVRQLTGCAIHLAVPDGADILYLERMYTLRTVQAMSDIRRRLPAHCTSSGKVISAFNESTAAARRRTGFPRMTDKSIRSCQEFDQAIAEARYRRIAFNRDEAATGVTSVAAPVLDRAGRAHAAISIVALTDDLTGGLGEPSRIVTAAAHKIAQVMHF